MPLLVFIQEHNTNRWRCKICPGQKYEPLSRARRHEDTVHHTSRVRELDRQPDSDHFGTTHQDSSPLSPPPSAYLPHVHPIHGPVQPGDHEDQIYDDYGGELAWHEDELSGREAGSSPIPNQDSDNDVYAWSDAGSGYNSNSESEPSVQDQPGADNNEHHIHIPPPSASHRITSLFEGLANDRQQEYASEPALIYTS